MPQDFGSGYVGGIDDRVRLVLGKDDVLVAEGYEVSQTILTQPSIFAIRLGYGGVIKDLTKKYPPNTKFQLRIGDTPRMTGWTDGYEVEQNDQATELNIRGRDSLAKLNDSFIQVERTFVSHTYRELVEQALKASGFTGTVLSSNAANRKLSSGIDIEATADDTATEDTVSPDGVGDVFRQAKARVGERWYHFVKRNLDRGGFALWSTADGNVVLSRPNANQKPVARILRGRGKPVNDVNVKHVRYRNETTHRFSEALVYGRYGGKKYGRARSKGGYVDDEMVSFGYERQYVAHDINVSNEKQAAFYASRKLAEFRRAGWHLTYTVSGHSTPAIGGKGRVVWAPDTIVDVQDDELGLSGPFWVESVTFKRPPTETTLVLMRPQDLLFGLTE